jgi:hypothetical protein
MQIPHVRMLAGTAVTAAMAAMAVGMAATANAAPAVARSGAATTTSTKAASSVTSKVTGSFTNSDGRGTFAGTFTPKKFSVVKGVLEATGTLTGTLTNADGSQIGTVHQAVTMPVDTAAAATDPSSCGILNLILGPLHLNLLGLVVNLNQVHLTITAVPGSGNLLGNLLCDVAHLLDSGGSLSEISTLLNEILALL